ncbi:hypothetical protein BHM03_00021597 [Ensete ventricosum]|nr:hypothetical protein BHM03_00021597 [Ensete ventricosum]
MRTTWYWYCTGTKMNLVHRYGLGEPVKVFANDQRKITCGLQFRLVPPGTGGIYRYTGRYHQKLTVAGRLREKSTVGGRLREKKGRRRRRGKEEKKRREESTFHVTSSPAGRPCSVTALARGHFFSRFVSPRGEKDRGDVASMTLPLFSRYQYHAGTKIISVHRSVYPYPCRSWKLAVGSTSLVTAASPCNELSFGIGFFPERASLIHPTAFAVKIESLTPGLPACVFLVRVGFSQFSLVSGD